MTELSSLTDDAIRAALAPAVPAEPPSDLADAIGVSVRRTRQRRVVVRWPWATDVGVAFRHTPAGRLAWVALALALLVMGLIGVGLVASQLRPPAPLSNGLIAIEQGDDIVLLDAATGELRTLDLGLSEKSAPSWSRDGSQLAFWSPSLVADGARSRYDIYTVRLEGGLVAGNPLAMFAAVEQPPIPASGIIGWSRDDSHLIFDLSWSGVPQVVISSTVLSAGIEPLSQPDEAADQPVVSPDGRFVAYRSRDLGGGDNWSVSVRDLDGAVNWAVFRENTQDVVQPGIFWSPDGGTLAFRVKEQGYRRIRLYVASRDGSGLRRLLTDRNPVWAAWSPNGSRLLFLDWQADSRTSDLWVAGTEGSEPRLLARGVCEVPAWSPDGNLILFAAGCRSPNSTEPWLIQSIRPDGSGLEIHLEVARPPEYLPCDYCQFGPRMGWQPVR
jgi:hypothetical protein